MSHEEAFIIIDLYVAGKLPFNFVVFQAYWLTTGG